MTEQPCTLVGSWTHLRASVYLHGCGSCVVVTHKVIAWKMFPICVAQLPSTASLHVHDNVRGQGWMRANLSIRLAVEHRFAHNKGNGPLPALLCASPWFLWPFVADRFRVFLRSRRATAPRLTAVRLTSDTHSSPAISLVA